ncbi:MAG: hypothetical protein ACRD1R_07005 [Acidobacteriota bacterium]
MYVGVVTVILGWTALFQAYSLVLYALAAGAVFHLATARALALGSRSCPPAPRPRWIGSAAVTPNPSMHRTVYRRARARRQTTGDLYKTCAEC